jgi:anti-sigma B factor antagonist
MTVRALRVEAFPIAPHATLHVAPVGPDGSIHVRLCGEIDLSSARAAEGALLACSRPGQSLIIDLSDLAYCDSQGIGLFFRLARELDHHGGQLTLTNPRGIVNRVFTMVDLPKTIQVSCDS